MIADRPRLAALARGYPDLPMVAAGDFDAICDARNYPATATCNLLRDAIQAADLVCLTRDGWIDHICVTPSLAAGATAAEPWQQNYIDERGNDPKRVSDHRGVEVTVRV